MNRLRSEKIAAYLRTHGAAGASVIAHAVMPPGERRAKVNAVRNTLRAMESRGQVWRINPGRAPALWRIEE